MKTKRMYIRFHQQLGYSDVPLPDVKIIKEVCQVFTHNNFVLNHRSNEGARLCPIYHNIIAQKQNTNRT